MKNYPVFIAVAVIGFALAGLVWYFAYPSYPAPMPPVACTQEAKLCPDGSYVGRTGPKCEFAACPSTTKPEPTPTPAPTPTPDPTASWETSTDRASGVTFQYPASLATVYLHTAEWPPTIHVDAKSFTCAKPKVVNGHSYCVTMTTEGAAGSIYTTYNFAFASGNKTVTLSFTIQAVQCDNFDEPQRTACKVEQKTFDVYELGDQMAQTVTLK